MQINDTQRVVVLRAGVYELAATLVLPRGWSVSSVRAVECATGAAPQIDVADLPDADVLG